MHKELNAHGIIELQNAIESIVKDCITDETIEKAQNMCEQDGGCEINSRLTISGRPEIISADDSWFDIIADDDDQDWLLHGSPYDRGGADSWYQRGRSPHYIFSGIRIEQADMTAEQIAEYETGFADNEKTGGRKDYA